MINVLRFCEFRYKKNMENAKEEIRVIHKKITDTTLTKGEKTKKNKTKKHSTKHFIKIVETEQRLLNQTIRV